MIALLALLLSAPLRAGDVDDGAQPEAQVEEPPPLEPLPDPNDPWRALLEEGPASREVHALGDSPDERLEEARERIRQGDPEGAGILAAQALERPGDHHQEATYLAAFALERQGAFTDAADRYGEVIARWPDGERADHARFRAAEALLAAGRPKQALRWHRTLRPFEDRPHGDFVKLALSEGTARLRAGRERKGLRQLAEALPVATEDEATFYQARARSAIAGVLLEESNALHLRTRERRQVRRLEQRAVLIQAAEKHVVAAAVLKEPEWVLQGLLDLGGAYEDVGDDLKEGRVPRSVRRGELRATYDEAVAEKVEVLWVKAARHYQKGIEVAERLGWESPRVAQLQAALDAVVAKVEE